MDIPPPKLYSFLPRRLDAFRHVPSTGAAGGILTAWTTSSFSLNYASSSPHSLTVCLSSTATNLSILITNVYAPATPNLKPDFLNELRAIASTVDKPWIICGDFNMIRYAHEKNNPNFHLAEADAFNDCINDLNLIELPLLDRLFTWTNKRTVPTLERLDRAFINLEWDGVLPSTLLSSMTRRTSDHVPLKIEISTAIPKSQVFRFENYWVKDATFLPIIVSAWNCRIPNSDPAVVISTKLKRTRRSIKSWRKSRPNLGQQETDCRIVIDLLDFVEEGRLLSPIEANLRSLVVRILDRVTQSKLLLWKQRSKIKAAIEGDENTKYFHACANQRLRKNKIQILEHDGCDVSNHDSKVAILHSFYLGLLDTEVNTTWHFCMNELYPER